MGRCKLLFLLVAIATSSGVAQRHDPLTPEESDQIRDFAQEPEKRIPLLIKFARTRIDNIDQLRTDSKAENRGKKIHDLLEDFREIVDETDDNIDEYSTKHTDLRKPLKVVVDGESEFETRLEGLRRSISGANSPLTDAHDFGFALQDAMEAVKLSLTDARQTLEEQNEAAKAAKEKK